MGILATLQTCAFTLSSVSNFICISSSFPCSSFLYLARRSRMCDSHASRGPWSWCWKAARIPPQWQCPATMMSFTFSTCTEYWITARTLMSEGGIWLAMFRCTKSSPGSNPTISFAGTRESEQPTHKYSGSCFLAKLGKKWGSESLRNSAQRRLFSMMAVKLSMMVDWLRMAGISWQETLWLSFLLGLRRIRCIRIQIQFRKCKAGSKSRETGLNSRERKGIDGEEDRKGGQPQRRFAQQLMIIRENHCIWTEEYVVKRIIQSKMTKIIQKQRHSNSQCQPYPPFRNNPNFIHTNKMFYFPNHPSLLKTPSPPLSPSISNQKMLQSTASLCEMHSILLPHELKDREPQHGIEGMREHLRRIPLIKPRKPLPLPQPLHHVAEHQLLLGRVHQGVPRDDDLQRVDHGGGDHCGGDGGEEGGCVAGVVEVQHLEGLELDRRVEGLCGEVDAGRFVEAQDALLCLDFAQALHG